MKETRFAKSIILVTLGLLLEIELAARESWRIERQGGVLLKHLHLIKTSGYPFALAQNRVNRTDMHVASNSNVELLDQKNE